MATCGCQLGNQTYCPKNPRIEKPNNQGPTTRATTKDPLTNKISGKSCTDRDGLPINEVAPSIPPPSVPKKKRSSRPFAHAAEIHRFQFVYRLCFHSLFVLEALPFATAFHFPRPRILPDLLRSPSSLYPSVVSFLFSCVCPVSNRAACSYLRGRE